MGGAKLITPGDPEQVFHVEGNIGRGSYGSVYNATRNSDKRQVAVKLLNVGETKASREALDREIEALKMCSSPYIVAFEGAYIEREQRVLWIAMERCYCSCLDAMNARGAAMSEDEIRLICDSALRALEYLHDTLRFVHRDVKASNLLLTQDGRCKLCDLGVAAELGPGGKRATVIGTPLWMSPELIQDGAYDEKTDIWSLGITLIELAEQHPPHWQINPPVRALFLIPAAPAPKLAEPKRWSADMLKFAGRCLDKDSRARASARELRASAFISKRAARGGEGLLRLVAAVEQKERERAAAIPPRPAPLGGGGGGGGVGGTAGTELLDGTLGAAHGVRPGETGRTLVAPAGGGGFGTLGTLVLSGSVSIQLPPIGPRRSPPRRSPSETSSVNGTLVVAHSPQPAEADEEGGAAATLRSDYGCGTMTGTSAGGHGMAGPRRAVLLGFPLKARQQAPPSPSAQQQGDASERAQARADGAGADAGNAGEGGALEISFADWVGELASATGDHASAALELGRLVLRKPELAASWLAGCEVGAVVDALTHANEALVQGALLNELERTAREGGSKALVAANAHLSIIGIVFSPFQPQYAYVRKSAINLLALMADSDEGHEALSSQQFFDPLCALARVLNDGDSPIDRAHAQQVVELVCKLLRGQHARTPRGNAAGLAALKRMSNSSHDLLATLRADATQAEVQRLITSIERVLQPIERSSTQTRGTFFGFG